MPHTWDKKHLPENEGGV